MAVIIQDVIDALTAPVGEIPNTVDELTFGSPFAEVKGIAVAFMATQQVLEQALRLGANLVITHEGLFYSHRPNRPTASARNGVFDAKKRIVEENEIAIYRFHDYWHRSLPDGITEGLIQALGWDSFVIEHLPTVAIVEIPPLTVEEVADHVKTSLGIGTLRAAGDLSMKCERIGVLTGYRGGGELAIPLFERHGLDLLLYGEGQEWETPEYVRDAVHLGRRNALLVLGHLESEQPGMKLLADRLGVLFPGISVHFCPVDPVFRMI